MGLGMGRKILLFSLAILIFLNGVSALSEGEVESFSYSGNIETFTVDSGGKYEFRLRGAQGYGSGGGEGGYSEGHATLNSGDTLYVRVGQEGQRGHGGGWPDGGDGVIDNGDAGGGGGASSIAIGTSDNEDRIIVAGGGGGVGGCDEEPGGYGGGLEGGIGNTYDSDHAAGGGGGSQVSGGESGYNRRGVGSYSRGEDGGFAQGGDAGPEEDQCGTGGGGGGWYGGGAASSDQHGSGWGAAGGGGSGYVDDSLEETSMDSGVNTGDGYVEIEFLDKGAGSSICDFRGPLNECIMNQTSQLQEQQYNISSIFESRESAVFEALTGRATLNLTNSTSISGLWKGAFNIQTEDPKLTSGAKFRPQSGSIIIGSK